MECGLKLRCELMSVGNNVMEDTGPCVKTPSLNAHHSLFFFSQPYSSQQSVFSKPSRPTKLSLVTGKWPLTIDGHVFHYTELELAWSKTSWKLLSTNLMSVPMGNANVSCKCYGSPEGCRYLNNKCKL